MMTRRSGYRPTYLPHVDRASGRVHLHARADARALHGAWLAVYVWYVSIYTRYAPPRPLVSFRTYIPLAAPMAAALASCAAASLGSDGVGVPACIVGACGGYRRRVNGMGWDR